MFILVSVLDLILHDLAHVLVVLLLPYLLQILVLFLFLFFLSSLFFFLLSYLTASILYYFGTVEGKKAKFFSIGALVTALLFILTSYLFGVYVEKFARYNELYGALGGLLILMFYIWLNSSILLLGFELNATLHTLRKNVKKVEK